MTEFLLRSNLKQNFQISVEILSAKIKEKYANVFLNTDLKKISFLYIFYLQILNFTTNKSLLQILRMNHNVLKDLKNSKLEENLTWNDFKNLINNILNLSGIDLFNMEIDKNKQNIQTLIELILYINNNFQITESEFNKIKSLVLIEKFEYNNQDELIDNLLLFGHFYENFLLINSNQTKLNDSKKTYGKFYTPRTIARFIIDKVFKEYCKEWGNITSLNILKLKILDPSMGTGNFLFEIIDYLLKEIKIFNKIEEKSNKFQIINNCIYGVDIDPIAVELARWGLFLYINTKEETFQVIKSRIRLGNSLLNIFSKDLIDKFPIINNLSINNENDVKKLLKIYLLSCFEEKPLESFRDLLNKGKNDRSKFKELLRSLQISSNKLDNIFLWEYEFPEIFNDNTNFGFDIIIGNPPHVENKKINPEEKKYLKSKLKNYTTTIKLYDYTIPFIELSSKLLKNKGVLGFISANKFLSADYGYKIRELLLKRTELMFLIDISNLKIFENALSYPIIIIFRKNSRNTQNEVKIGLISEKIEIKSDFDSYIEFNTIPQKTLEMIPNKIFPLSSNIGRLIYILNKENVILLDNLCEMRYRPLKFTGWGKFLDRISESENAFPSEPLKFIACGNIEQYGINWNKNLRLLKTKFKRSYIFRPPSIPLKKWEILKKPKILIREIARNLTCVFDENGEYGNLTGMYILFDFKISPYYLLAILNSKSMNNIYKILFGSVHLQGGYLNYHASYLKTLPIFRNVSNIDGDINYDSYNERLSIKKLLSKILDNEFDINIIKELISNKDSKSIYFLIIEISMELQDITEQKLKILNEFYFLIEKKFQTSIENFKNKRDLLKFYKYDWNRVEMILERNSQLFKMNKNEFKDSIKEIRKNYEYIIIKYNLKIKQYINLKEYLDNIIEYMYFN